MEQVGLDNFFHHFYDSKDFLRNSWKKWKSCQNQFFPRFGPPKRLESWKKLARTTFSTNFWGSFFFFTKMVEKVSLDNFFHHFYDSKDFLRNSWKKWKSGKSCQDQLFPRLKPFWRPKSWKKLARPTFYAFYQYFPCLRRSPLISC